MIAKVKDRIQLTIVDTPKKHDPRSAAIDHAVLVSALLVCLYLPKLLDLLQVGQENRLARLE